MVVVEVIKSILYLRRIIEISSRDVFASMREQERREEDLGRGRFFRFLLEWINPSWVALTQDSEEKVYRHENDKNHEKRPTRGSHGVKGCVKRE